MALINKYNLNNKIKVLNSVNNNELPAILNLAKIFLLTSEREALSTALMEAMSCGLVPVVSNVGDLNTLVIDKHTGLVVDSLDPNEFSKAINFLIKNPDEQQRMGKNARKLIIKEHSYESTSKLWEIFFKMRKKL